MASEFRRRDERRADRRAGRCNPLPQELEFRTDFYNSRTYDDLDKVTLEVSEDGRLRIFIDGGVKRGRPGER